MTEEFRDLNADRPPTPGGPASAGLTHSGHGPGQCRPGCVAWELLSADEQAAQMTDAQMLGAAAQRLGLVNQPVNQRCTCDGGGSAGCPAHDPVNDFQPLVTLIRQVREAAYDAGLADGDPSVTLADKRAAADAYGDAIESVNQRLDEMGLR